MSPKTASEVERLREAEAEFVRKLREDPEFTRAMDAAEDPDSLLGLSDLLEKYPHLK